MAAVNNLAYDISVYEPNPKKQPQRKIEVKKVAKVKQVSAVKSLLLGFAAMVLLCAMLYGKVETSKLYKQTAQLSKQYDMLTSENARMQSEIESKISLNKIDTYATNKLGLQKLDKSQTEYLSIQKSDVTKVVKDENKNVLLIIKDWFSNVLEYIGA